MTTRPAFRLLKFERHDAAPPPAPITPAAELAMRVAGRVYELAVVNLPMAGALEALVNEFVDDRVSS